jgi:hypothetical protein
MLESSTLAKEKQDAFQSMLRTGRILVWVNMLHEELVVPHAVQMTPLSPLAYTPEVRPQATNEGIVALMWLGGRTFQTFVPWTAVYFIGSKRGQMSWLQHAPEDLSGADLESICADLDAEYDDHLVGDEVDREVVVGPRAPTSEEAAAAPALSPRSQAGDIGEPQPADTPSSTGTTFPRASTPSLKVILGGGQDAED